MTDLVLYHFDGCPYCQKVKDYLTENNITVPMKDIREDASAKEELLQVGGKGQVPCLFIDGDPLYESDDIVSWFQNNYEGE